MLKRFPVFTEIFLDIPIPMAYRFIVMKILAGIFFSSKKFELI